MAERFLQEARIAAQLQHHNIIVVHEVQHDAELIFFVRRLVEGGSLDALLPVLGAGLSIDGSSTRSGLAKIATELQTARESAVAAWCWWGPHATCAPR